MIHSKASFDRFVSKVHQPSGWDGCWLWLGWKNQNMGHVMLWDSRQHCDRPASQIAWEIFHRKAFPKKLVSCHSCDNPPCVNPLHIRAGTLKSNAYECIAKGRMKAPPRRARCIRGHPLNGHNILHSTNGRQCRTCANEAAKRYRAKKKKEKVKWVKK